MASEVNESLKLQITVVMPTSPVPSHPSTAILEETVASVRHWLPDAEIFLTFDGLGPDHLHRHDTYEEYIRRALWLADHGGWGPVVPHVFTTHHHQSGMMRRVLPDIETPLLLYVEHDTPLVTDEHIDFAAAGEFLHGGRGDLLRFHHESVIPDEHQHMMHYGYWYRCGVIRTSQWSQRPHLATTAFYDRILTSHFGWDDKVFIEDQMHGIAHNAFLNYGMEGWQQYRLHIYDPGGGNLKRSYHLDGRKSQ